MTTPQKPGAQAATEPTTTTPAEPPKEQASTTTPAPAAATPAAATPSASDEKQRIKGIQGCDEAKGREGLASHLAFETAMSPGEAKTLLAASPKAAAEGSDKAENPFTAAMANGNPNVGADGQLASGGQSADRTSALLRDYGAASGRTFN